MVIREPETSTREGPLQEYCRPRSTSFGNRERHQLPRTNQLRRRRQFHLQSLRQRTQRLFHFGVRGHSDPGRRSVQGLGLHRHQHRLRRADLLLQGSPKVQIQQRTYLQDQRDRRQVP